MADPMQEQQAGGAQAQADTPLLESIMAETKIKPNDESYSVAKRGLQAFLQHILSKRSEGVQVRQAVVNEMIAELDKTLSSQVDVILHHSQLQKMESAWRGLKMVVDRTDFRENCKIEILNVSKEDLLADFEDSPEVVKSGLYKSIYTENYGVFGGEPVGTMV